MRIAPSSYYSVMKSHNKPIRKSNHEIHDNSYFSIRTNILSQLCTSFRVRIIRREQTSMYAFYHMRIYRGEQSSTPAFFLWAFMTVFFCPQSCWSLIVGRNFWISRHHFEKVLAVLTGPTIKRPQGNFPLSFRAHPLLDIIIQGSFPYLISNIY